MIKKRKKTSPRKKLIKKLDTITSLIVRLRDTQCVICKSKQQLTNGHLWSRSVYTTRWDLENCNAQCWGCNFRHEFDPYPYQEWFKKKFGEAAYHSLYQKFHKTRKYSDRELTELFSELIILHNKMQEKTPIRRYSSSRL